MEQKIEMGKSAGDYIIIGESTKKLFSLIPEGNIRTYLLIYKLLVKAQVNKNG